MSVVFFQYTSSFLSQQVHAHVLPGCVPMFCVLHNFFQKKDTQVLDFSFFQFYTSLQSGKNLCIMWLMWVEMIHINI